MYVPLTFVPYETGDDVVSGGEWILEPEADGVLLEGEKDGPTDGTALGLAQEWNEFGPVVGAQVG